MKKLFALLLMLTLLNPMILVLSFAESPSGWAQNEVEILKSTGYFDVSRFVQYQKPITRLEFIYFASRLFETMSGQEIQVDPKISFTDTSDIWALKGATIGITSGIGGDQFGPNLELTREQFATMIIKTIQLGNLPLSKPGNYTFKDDHEINSWAKEAIYIAKENNILNGVGNDLCAPKKDATIEQCLVLISNILRNNQGKAFTYNAKTNIISYEIKLKTDTRLSWMDEGYIGERKNGKPHGLGIAFWYGAKTYMGEIKDGLANGQGTYISPGDFKYMGEWKDNSQNGRGTVIFPDGTVLGGQFKDGKEHGIMTRITRNGYIHVEQFIDGVKHGQATETLPDGTIYKRQFDNGEKYGEETKTSPDGETVIVGRWYGNIFWELPGVQ